MSVKLTPVGDWTADVEAGLKERMGYAAGVIGRSGNEACKHALILMAQSAAALTPTAKAKRPEMRDMGLHGAKYVEVYNRGKPVTRLYKWHFMDTARPEDKMPGTWDQARTIGGRGLAKRSWSWGMGKLGVRPTGGRSPMRGITSLLTLNSEKVSGYILTDRLAYMLKIMPAGWETLVKVRAGNKIMANAKRKIEAEWRDVGRTGMKQGRALARFALKAA